MKKISWETIYMPLDFNLRAFLERLNAFWINYAISSKNRLYDVLGVFNDITVSLFCDWCQNGQSKTWIPRLVFLLALFWSNVVHLRNDLIPYQVISEQSLSAGYGNGYTDEQETYTVYWDKDVRYDYAAEIEGNSMEPKFHSGDIALIRKTHVYDYDGCVCVIDDIANQRVYIKKIHIEDTHVRLESLNKDTYDNGELIYPDILLENTENLRLIGKVIDSFKPIEIK